MAKETGNPPHPEVMIPLVATRRELEITRAQVDKIAEEVFAEAGQRIEYSVGTMIELPRAACWRPTRLPRSPTSSASAPTT